METSQKTQPAKREPSAAVADLLREQPMLWQGTAGMSGQLRPGLCSGYAQLDKLLPAKGWPCPGVIELLDHQPGHGEMSLFLPVMRQLIGSGYQLAMVAAPQLPYAPALASAGLDLQRLLLVQPQGDSEIAWAMEQLLRQPCCGLVMAWAGGGNIRFWQRAVRRLQLACQAGDSLAILLRAGRDSLGVASMSLRLRRQADGLNLQLLKVRGSHLRSQLLLQPAS